MWVVWANVVVIILILWKLFPRLFKCIGCCCKWSYFIVLTITVVVMSIVIYLIVDTLTYGNPIGIVYMHIDNTGEYKYKDIMRYSKFLKECLNENKSCDLFPSDLIRCIKNNEDCEYGEFTNLIL